MPHSWRYFSLFFLVSAILLSVGVALAWYPQSIINSLEDNLRNGNLSQNDKYAIAGSLSWWLLAKVQTYDLISNILSLSGIFLMIYSFIYLFFTIWNDSRHEELRQKKLIENSKNKTSENDKNSIPPKKEKKETVLPEAGGTLMTSEQNSEFDAAVARADALRNISETVILENNRGTKLFKERFIYEGKSYPISEMKHASVQSGLVPLASLMIQFKNGETREFNVGSTSSSSMPNSLSSDGMVDHYISGDLKASTQQWATAINMLIANNIK